MWKIKIKSTNFLCNVFSFKNTRLTEILDYSDHQGNQGY